MTIFGWDMSHYDSPNIGTAIAEGIEFITHKAGGDSNDAELGTWWAGARDDRARCLMGAYWVLYPGSASARADTFLARLDALCPGWRDGPFILQVDCEKWNGDPGTVPSVGEINTFCDRLVAKTDFRPVVYAPDWVYGDLSALRYPLWSSKYVTAKAAGFKEMYPGDNSSKWASYGGKTPAILQYTSKAIIGGQTTCDANAYKGTRAQLTALVAPEWDENMSAGIDATDVKTILTTDGLIANPSNASDAKTNPKLTLAEAVTNTYYRAISADTTGKALLLAIQALASKDQVDEVALAGALAPAVAAAVLAGLPTDADDISQEEVNEAVEAAFAKAFGTPAA